MSVADFRSPASCQHHERDAQGVGRGGSSPVDFLFAVVAAT
jgi:hypothetical protein